jgi:transcription elongation factor Elf1
MHGVRQEGTAEEDSMNGQTQAHVTSDASRRLALPACPKCDDLQFAPAASEFVSKGKVRHFWSCEACGHEFSTSVKLAFLQGV